MSFLPENYESPKSSNYYMKLQDGENRIRILTKPVMGWEDWQEKKPARFTYDKKPVKSIDPRKPVRHFWAFVVYNYIDKRIQILNVLQSTIRKSLEALCRDDDWGDPYLYDIKITKAGEGVDTEYTVNPVPHKAVEQSIIEMFNENRCNLEALFTNEDPFASHWEVYSSLGIEDKKISKFITADQANGLSELLKSCDEKYVKSLWKTLNNQSITSTNQIPVILYDKIRVAMMNNQKKSENHIDNVFPMNSMDELSQAVGE